MSCIACTIFGLPQLFVRRLGPGGEASSLLFNASLRLALPPGAPLDAIAPQQRSQHGRPD